MKFVVNSEILFRAGELIKKIIANNPAVVAIENYLVRVADGFVKLTATNLQSTFEVTLPRKAYDSAVQLAGSFLVPAKQLQAHLKGLNQPLVIETGPDYSVTVTDGDGSAKFVGDDIENFPNTPKVENGTSWSLVVPFDLFEDFLKYVSKDELRPALCSLFFDSVGGKLTLVGTDGHRVRVTHTEQSNDRKFLLSRDAVVLLKTFKPADTLVTVNDTNVRFEFAVGEFKIAFTSRTTDAPYPDYVRVIPALSDAKVVAELDRKEFLKQLGKALNFANKTTNAVELALNGKLELSASDTDFKHAYSGKLSGTKTGGEIHIGFNGRFLNEILDTFEGKNVTAYLTEASRAGVFTGDGAPGTEVILMPIMLKQYI